MKKILTITCILVALVSGATYYFLVYKNQEVSTPITLQEKPTTQIAPPVQRDISLLKDNIVSRDFKTQIIMNESLVLENPVISSNYALQNWNDENKGGQALLKYNPSQGWVLVSMGGGVWGVSDLVDVGVPRDIARQLVDGSKK